MSERRGEDAASEVEELRAYVRAVDRWLAESDEQRNLNADKHVHVIAPLDSAERVVGITRHFLGKKFPHLNGDIGRYATEET